ncbi:hypothetical protein TanjilG_17906 [Lupinus angustifolius]|uniref:Uncharacterized protein n=1 Tax=Lupinus angustifolius TaxID=3871 RepID=A0A1J7HLH2_LUPAN|nr:hypothetical protein TanjilG_17906 [Lupinus angustifolius]
MVEISRNRAYLFAGGGSHGGEHRRRQPYCNQSSRCSKRCVFGKWPIGDLAFGINYFMRKQGNLAVASVYAGSECVQLKGDEIVVELYELLRLLTLCMIFSKKPFSVFLDSAGFSVGYVLSSFPFSISVLRCYTTSDPKWFSQTVVMKRAQSIAEAVVRTRSSLSSWSCMSTRRRNVASSPNSKAGDLIEAPLISETTTESFFLEEVVRDPRLRNEHNSSSGGSGHDDTDEDEEYPIPSYHEISASTIDDDITEGQLWKKRLQQQQQQQKRSLKKRISLLMLQNAVIQSQQHLTTSTAIDFIYQAESCIWSPYLLHLMIQTQVLRNMCTYMKHQESCTASSGFQKL